MKRVQICYHIYYCHPETCNHDNHNSWWVQDKDFVWDKLKSKKEAIKYCEDAGYEYTIEIPQWV